MSTETFRSDHASIKTGYTEDVRSLDHTTPSNLRASGAPGSEFGRADQPIDRSFVFVRVSSDQSEVRLHHRSLRHDAVLDLLDCPIGTTSMHGIEFNNGICHGYA